MRAIDNNFETEVVLLFAEELVIRSGRELQEALTDTDRVFDPVVFVAAFLGGVVTGLSPGARKIFFEREFPPVAVHRVVEALSAS